MIAQAAFDLLGDLPILFQNHTVLRKENREQRKETRLATKVTFSFLKATCFWINGRFPISILSSLLSILISVWFQIILSINLFYDSLNRIHISHCIIMHTRHSFLF